MEHGSEITGQKFISDHLLKFELKTFTYLETSVKWMYVVSLFTEVFLYFSKLNPLNNIYE